MGDLFHESVPDTWIAAVFFLMAMESQHTFILLTKRPKRMYEYMTDKTNFLVMEEMFHCSTLSDHLREDVGVGAMKSGIFYASNLFRKGWALPNVWFGVTVETKDQLGRVDILQNTPAAKRIVSVEPMLGPVDLDEHLWRYLPRDEVPGRLLNAYDGVGGPFVERKNLLHWVICGGETGPKARPMRPDWARNLRDQCAEAGVPFFFKQWGEFSESGERVGKNKAGHLLDGKEHREIPARF